MTDLTRISRDVAYTVSNFGQRGTIGWDSVSGKLGSLSRSLLDSGVKVPYLCSKEDIDAITAALPNRFVMFSQDGDDVSHPHIKFLSNYITKSIRNKDFTGKKIKLVGPKFDKSEIDCFKSAESVHYCTYHPISKDESRCISSREAIEKRLRLTKLSLESVKREILACEKNICDHPASGHSKGVRENVKDRLAEQVELEMTIDKLTQELSVFLSESFIEQNIACNVGAQKCSIEADKIVAFDSIYDIDLQELVVKAEQIGADEIFASVILPFGLLFVPEYASPELGVRFRRDGEGFIMTHMKDMSNGYVHSKSKTIMQLMKSSFIEPRNIVKTVSKTWAYEIIKDVAEICLLRIYPVNETSRIVRKLMPAKFDKYCVIYNPVEYFALMPKLEPMLIEVDKLEYTIAMAMRTKNTNKIIEDLAQYVQCLYMRVVIGKTELQSGGSVTAETASAIILYAMLEAGTRKSGIGKSYKKAVHNSKWYAKIPNAIFEGVKTKLYEMFPGFFDFFLNSRIEKYMASRINLADQILDSRRSDFGNVFDILRMTTEFVYDNRDEFLDSLPTLGELFTMPASGLRNYQKRLLEKAYGTHHFDTQKACSSMMLALTGAEHGLLQATVMKQRNLHSAKIEHDYTCMKETVLRNEASEAEERIEQAHQRVLEAERILKNDRLLRERELDPIEPTLPETEIDFSSSGIGEIPLDAHRSDSRHHANFEMDDLVQTMFNINTRLADRLKKGKSLTDREVKGFIEKLTKPAVASKLAIPKDEVKKQVARLIDSYKLSTENETVKSFKKLKLSVLDIAKKTLRGGKLDDLERKIIEVLKGSAGCGKTTLTVDRFDPDQDAYLAPFAKVAIDTCAKLKEKYGMEREYRVKTFEKIAEIPRSGGTMYVDESSAFSLPYLLLIIGYFDYDRFVFIGDDEQTEFYDPTGDLVDPSLRSFMQLVPEECVGKIFYSFRYGPTVAAFLNCTYNYPVISLKRAETAITYHDIMEFNGETPGVNLTISNATVEKYTGLGAQNICTAKSCQGKTFQRTNFVLEPNDLFGAFQYRQQGIVAASRCTEELHIYYDRYSKSTREKANLEVMLTNYETLFEVAVPHESDF